MTAFNAVRFRVKPGREDEFLNAHKKIERNWAGLQDLQRSQSCSAIGEASVELRARTEGRGVFAGRRLNAAAANLKSTLTLPTASCAATSRLFASKGGGARKQATSQSQLLGTRAVAP